MDETFFLAAEQHRPYAVFLTLKEAREDIQPFLDNGFDFRVIEVRVTAWHRLEGKWVREEVNGDA